MKKLITFFFTILFLIACRKDKQVYINEGFLKGTKWVTVSKTKNGIVDPSDPIELSTLDFRNDGKMYFRQTTPFFFRDTVNYEFVDNNNIRISKPWASYKVNINYAVNLLTPTNFDFTITSTEYSDVYFYKTIRQ
jgi:hypothetical protein